MDIPDIQYAILEAYHSRKHGIDMTNAGLILMRL